MERLKLSDITIGMKVRRTISVLGIDGSVTETVKEPIYTVTDINEYGDVEFTVKGGKHWACHPSYLVAAEAVQ
jgi:hypothetical protein